MNLKKAGLALGVAAGIGAPAMNAHADGFYLGLFGGANLMFSDVKGNFNSQILDFFPGTSVSYKFDPTTVGIVVGGVAGYQWDWGLRVEGEVSWRRNNFNFASATVTNPGIPTGSINVGVVVDGAVSTLAGMANVYYDFRLWRLRPYVGIGVGAAQTQLHIKNPLIPASINSSDVTLAFQAMAGINYAVTSSVMLGLEYRFFGVLGPDWNLSDLTVPFTTSLNNRNIYSHALLLTAKYSFNGEYKTDTIAPTNPLLWAQGWYMGLQGGINLQHSNAPNPSIEFNGTSLTLPAGLNIGASARTGYAVGGVVGFAFPMGLRAEGEITYRSNRQDYNLEGTLIPGLPSPTIAYSNITSVAIMGNAYWDFRINERWRPYIGGGVGVSIISADLKLAAFGAEGDLGSDTKYVFAYQAMAGVQYFLQNDFAIGLEYKFHGTLDPTFKSKLIEVSGPVNFTASAKFDHSAYFNHAIMATVKYYFGK